MDHQKKFLLDSSIIIAYFNPNDSCHIQAVKLIKKSIEDGGILFIHLLAFVECLQILKMRASADVIRLFKETVIRRQAISLIETTRLPSEKSLSFTLFHAQNNLSFIDAVQIEYALHENMKLITLDKELQKVYSTYTT